jgi:hypothetical protein
VVQVSEENTCGSTDNESYIPWAKLLMRVHGFDILRCECGGRVLVKAHVIRSFHNEACLPSD